MPANNSGKFVERFEEAVMQFVVLEKASQGEVTRENLQQTFSGNLKMKYDHLDHCLDTLVQENHLKKEGNKYRATDDGREDIQEVQRIAMELANIAQQTQGTKQQTQPGQPKGGPGASTR